MAHVAAPDMDLHCLPWFPFWDAVHMFKIIANIPTDPLKKQYLFSHCTDVDECLDFPCVNGACYNLVGSYNCSCQTGWSGNNCQTGT